VNPPSKASTPRPAGASTPVITDDMLHTVLRRRANGESVEAIRPDLIIPTGKRRGRNPSLASIYRTLAAHDKAQAYPEAIEAATPASYASRPPGDRAAARADARRHPHRPAAWATRDLPLGIRTRQDLRARP
jgi:hypothetical protein